MIRVHLDQAASILQAGGVVIFPTETVYGIGANACSNEACRKIYQYKGRPPDNPLIVHVYSNEELAKYAKLSLEASKVIEAFTPGPLTIIAQRIDADVLPENREPSAIADVPCCGKKTIALRIPSHSIARSLLRMCKLPIAAPSANVSGKLSPSDFDMARYNFANTQLPMLDGGVCEFGIESTIVSFIDEPRILRTGYISAEDIYKRTGVDVSVGLSRGGTPGSGYKHYTPEVDLIVYARIDDIISSLGKRSGIIAFEQDKQKLENMHIPQECIIRFVANNADYSRRLYQLLHECRHMENIFAPYVKDSQFGLQERLEKAMTDAFL